jgi:hypothetical protein
MNYSSFHLEVLDRADQDGRYPPHTGSVFGMAACELVEWGDLTPAGDLTESGRAVLSRAGR